MFYRAKISQDVREKGWRIMVNPFDPNELQVFLNDLYTWYADNTSRGRKRHRVPSWTEFAQWLGWNNSTLSAYMNGTRGQPAL